MLRYIAPMGARYISTQLNYNGSYIRERRLFPRRGCAADLEDGMRLLNGENWREFGGDLEGFRVEVCDELYGFCSHNSILY